MNLCIVSDGAAYKGGSRLYQTQDTFVLYINELSKHFSHVNCFMPIFSQSNLQSTILWHPPENVHIVPAHPCLTVKEYYRNMSTILRKNIRPLLSCIKQSDVVLLRIPSVNAFLGHLLSRIHKKDVVTYLKGSQKEVVWSSGKYRGVSRIVVRNVVRFHEFLTRSIMDRALLNIFLGTHLAKTHGRLIDNNQQNYLSFTSLVTDNDIVEREQTLSRDRVKLLYVGRLSPEKGLHYLVLAVSILRQQGWEVSLEIVGDEKETGERDELLKLICEIGLPSCVQCTGFVPYGEALDSYYLHSNIFVLPSINEGIPKVILEAMSKGLPVIATRVGGIPDIIKNKENGLLVPPMSSEAIVRAVKSLLEDEQLRRRIVENGYRFVREHTIEKQARRLVDLIYTTSQKALALKDN